MLSACLDQVIKNFYVFLLLGFFLLTFSIGFPVTLNQRILLLLFLNKIASLGIRWRKAKDKKIPYENNVNI